MFFERDGSLKRRFPLGYSLPDQHQQATTTHADGLRLLSLSALSYEASNRAEAPGFLKCTEIGFPRSYSTGLETNEAVSDHSFHTPLWA